MIEQRLSSKSVAPHQSAGPDFAVEIDAGHAGYDACASFSSPKPEFAKYRGGNSGEKKPDIFVSGESNPFGSEEE
ncbi:MAG: hypothetical protein Q7T25_15445 [Sideroxyarcus sp.]|nr:hypothetical protein [Sideroxyarcus sp.]